MSGYQIHGRDWTVSVPMHLVYTDEATDRSMVYLDDLPKIIAAYLRAMAGRYPAEVFAPESTWPDAIAGTALRTVLYAEAARLTEETP